MRSALLDHISPAETAGAATDTMTAVGRAAQDGDDDLDDDDFDEDRDGGDDGDDEDGDDDDEDDDVETWQVRRSTPHL